MTTEALFKFILDLLNTSTASVIIGGLIGALLGKSTDEEDKIKTDKFNESQI